MWSAPPSRVSGLFAQIRIDLELVILAGLLFGVIIAGIVVVTRVRNWRKEPPPAPTLDEQLESYQALVEQGEMEPEELARIKAHLERLAEGPPATNPNARQPPV